MVRVPSMLLPQRFNVWLWTECILKLCKKRYYNFNTQRWSYWAIEFQAHYDGTNCHKIFSLNFSKTYDGHVSSLTERQKSFRKEDGTANNLITIQAIAEKNIKNLKPLNLALDIKKAFDSVNIGLQKDGSSGSTSMIYRQFSSNLIVIGGWDQPVRFCKWFRWWCADQAYRSLRTGWKTARVECFPWSTRAFFCLQSYGR